MTQRQVTLKNPTGLHARPASQLTALCKEFPEDITLLAKGTQINPKSIISILTAGMACGTEVTVQVEGADEQAVCDKIVAFIEGLKE